MFQDGQRHCEFCHGQHLRKKSRKKKKRQRDVAKRRMVLRVGLQDAVQLVSVFISCDHPRSNPHLFGLHCLRRPKKKPALPTGGMGFLPQVRASLPRLQRRMSLDEFRGGKEVTKCEQHVTKLNIAEDEHVKYANFIQSQLQFVVSNSFKNIVTGTKADDKYHFSRHGGACAS